MKEQEKREWKDDLEKVREFATAINVRFDIVVRTGEVGSPRVSKAFDIYNRLEHICYELEQLESSINA